MTVRIVVLGAGVSGLTTALLLSKNPSYSVTVVAKHMPGDYSIEYTSPFAGANFQPLSKESEARWEERSWPEMARLAAHVPEAGIHFQSSRIYRRKEELENGGASFDSMFSLDPWFRRLFPDFRSLEQHELPEGVHSGCAYTGICINTAVYLPWLLGQCKKQGVVFRRATVANIHEVGRLHHTRQKADVVINASGLGALRLGGVMDTSMVPIRGQTVLVENEAQPMYNVSGTDDGPEEVSYLMTRAAGGGTILGGTYQKGNWDPNPDDATTQRIIKRCVALSPELAGEKGIAGVRVIKASVGLRPWRRDGVRVEADHDTLAEDEILVVHNYGHAGWGYQGSYGCAEHVVDLVNESMAHRRGVKNLLSKL